jgi:hypothetical protein
MKKISKKQQRRTDAFHDLLRGDLVHARAVTLTAVLALEGKNKGVLHEISIALRGAANRLNNVLQKLEGTAHE